MQSLKFKVVLLIGVFCFFILSCTGRDPIEIQEPIRESSNPPSDSNVIGVSITNPFNELAECIIDQDWCVQGSGIENPCGANSKIIDITSNNVENSMCWYIFFYSLKILL